MQETEVEDRRRHRGKESDVWMDNGGRESPLPVHIFRRQPEQGSAGCLRAREKKSKVALRRASSNWPRRCCHISWRR